jgi:hypothetical protein
MSAIRGATLRIASTGLSTLAVLAFTSASYADSSVLAAGCSAPAAQNKAQIERCEMQLVPATKAQIEYVERGRAVPSPAPSAAAGRPRAVHGNAGGGDPKSWELALSALAGAAVTGAAVAGTHRVRLQRHPA